jgi:hypothetical protein
MKSAYNAGGHINEQELILTLVYFQINAQNSYLFIYLYIIHLLKSSTCFEHCPAYHQEVYVIIVYIYMQLLVSSLSASDCLVHRLREITT